MKAIDIEKLREMSGRFLLHGGDSRVVDFFMEQELNPTCIVADNLALDANKSDGAKITTTEEALRVYGNKTPVFVMFFLQPNEYEKLNELGFSEIITSDKRMKDMFHLWRGENRAREMNNDLSRSLLLDYMRAIYGDISMSKLRKLATTLELDWKSDDVLLIPRIGHIITTRCMLDCRHCVALTHYMKRSKNAPPQDRPLRECLEDIDVLLSSVDKVGMYGLATGEALLHPNVGDILDVALEADKIQTVAVYTAGTLLPSKEILNRLQHPKIRVTVSNYGEVSTKINELRELLVSNDIAFRELVKHDGLGWYDFGKPTKKGRSNEYNRSLFHECHEASFACTSIGGGKFYRCMRTFQGSQLGLIPHFDTDFVDLLNMNVSERKGALRGLYALREIATCDYCDGPRGAPIEAAGQCGDFNPWEE